MRFNKYQINTILDKLYTDIKENEYDIFQNQQKTKYDITVNREDDSRHSGRGNGITQIQLRYSANDLHTQANNVNMVNVERATNGLILTLSTGSKNLRGDYVFKFPRFADGTMRRWKKITKLIDEITNKIKTDHRSVQQREFDEEFNNFYTDMYPHEINKILLGDDDDA